MSGEGNSIKPKSEKLRPKKKFRLLKFTFFSFLGLVLLIVLLVALTQTQFFRNQVRYYLTGIFNEHFSDREALLKIGDLKGNFIDELTFMDVELTVQKDIMFRFDELNLKYNLPALFNKNIEADVIKLINPEINFTRIRTPSGDSVWNFEYLFRPVEEEPEEEKKFEWKIILNSVLVENLGFRMLGYKAQDIPVNQLKITDETYFNTENLKISNLNLNANGEYSSELINLSVNHLGFSTNFDFQLNKLHGEFYLSNQKSEITGLKIETSRSNITSEYIFADGIDILNADSTLLISGKNNNSGLSLVADKFDFTDLKLFVPQADFLNGNIYLNLKAGGNIDDITVQNLQLRTQNSYFNFQGKLANLSDPTNIRLDITGQNLEIYPGDTRIHVPGLNIPDYSHIGKVTGGLTYNGNFSDFRTTFDLKFLGSSLKGYLDLNLNSNNYNALVEARNLNPGQILLQDNLKGNINCLAELNGSGFGLSDINTKVKYEITDTRIFDQKIDRSLGELYIRNYNVDMDIKYISDQLNVSVNGNVNIRDFNNPLYSLKGEVRNLDISDFTGNSSDKSRIGFTFDFNGKGIDPDKLEGVYNLNLDESYYGDYSIVPTPVNIKISRGYADYFTLNSKIIDLKAEGKIRFTQLGDVIGRNISMLQESVLNKLSMDTIRTVRTNTVNNAEFGFSFELITKDPEAIEKMFLLNDIRFSGRVDGKISNSSSAFKSYSVIKIDELKYRDSSLVIDNLRAEINHENYYGKYDFKDFSSYNSSISLRAEKVINNSNQIDRISLNMGLNDSGSKISFRVGNDSVLSGVFKGQLDLSGENISLSIDSVEFGYYGLKVHNNEKLYLTYSKKNNNRMVSFDKFVLGGDFLNAKVEGVLSFDQSSDLIAEITDVDIPSLIKYSTDYKDINGIIQKDYGLKGKIRRFTVLMKGDVENPELSLEMNTGIIRYNEMRVGRVDAFIDYASQNLSADILVRNAEGIGRMRLKGDIPFNNPFSVPDSITYANMISAPLNINLEATDFQINFFSKIIPNFSDIRGYLNARLSASGTLLKPELSGDATIQKGRFFFTWTGMNYKFESILKASNSDLVVENFALYNENDPARHIDLYGRVRFAGLGISEIDLTTRGDMYIFDASSIQNRFGFYGEMLAGIGNPAITIKGNLSNLNVSGQLLIKKAKLYFPSITGLEYDIFSDDFTYRIFTDPEAKVFLDTIINITQESAGNLDPFLRYNYILQKSEPSVSDYLTYDLDILFERNVYVNMNMNPITREELNGEFQGNLKLDNKTPARNFQLFGRLNIVGDSYYRFYKNFKIYDSYLDFIGDYNDPLLKIEAKYTNYRTVEGSTEKVYVILEIEGTRYNPRLTLSIETEDGIVETGSQAQTDAISYLLFGVPQRDLSGGSIGSSVLSNLGSNIGSGVASSLLYEALRNIAPFILNTELTYTGGDITGTDIRVTSAFGDAIVRVGGKIFTDINNLEVSVEYPLNRLFNINVSNNLVIEVSRVKSTSLFNVNEGFETRAGLTYKIRY